MNTTILLTNVETAVNIISIIITWNITSPQKHGVGIWRYYKSFYNNKFYNKRQFERTPKLYPVTFAFKKDVTLGAETPHRRTLPSTEHLIEFILTNQEIWFIIISIIIKRIIMGGGFGRREPLLWFIVPIDAKEIIDMAKKFIGRREELKLLDRLWQSQDAELIILYGRRRVGKTRLLTHWINQHQRQQTGLYWMAEPTSAVDQLRSFSQALSNYTDPEEPAPLDFTYANWEQAFRQVSLIAKGRRMALFIDEITYLIDINPDIVGILQKVWDHRLQESNLLLAFSGSQRGVMEKNLLNYEAPLYGRATSTLKLQPLPFGVTARYFPEYTPEDRVALYAIWGGVPAYWERIDPTKSVLENLQEQLLPSNAWMLDEPRLLLQEFLTDMYNYVGIMRGMAYGAHTLKDIGDHNGLSSTTVGSYLSILRDTDFVNRIVPVTQREQKSRLGKYVITDPYLRFYFRFLAAYQSKLAMGQQQVVLQSIEDNLPSFIEANTWREICQEWLLRASDHGELPVSIMAVGGEWKRKLEVDVAGIDEDNNCIVLGCALWQTEPADLKPVQELVQLTKSILPRKAAWRIYYLGFSASGWTKAALVKAKRTVQGERNNRSREQWEIVGIRLLDLAEVDKDLTQWSEAS